MTLVFSFKAKKTHVISDSILESSSIKKEVRLKQRFQINFTSNLISDSVLESTSIKKKV